MSSFGFLFLLYEPFLVLLARLYEPHLQHVLGYAEEVHRKHSGAAATECEEAGQGGDWNQPSAKT